MTASILAGRGVKGYAVFYHTLPRRKDPSTGRWPKIEYNVVFVRVCGSDEDPISEAQKILDGFNVYVDKVFDRVKQLETAKGDFFGNIYKYGKMKSYRWPQRAALPQVEKS